MVLYAAILLPAASFLTATAFIRLLRIQVGLENAYVIKKAETAYKVHIKSVIGLRGLKISMVSLPYRPHNSEALLFKSGLLTDTIDVLKHETVHSYPVSFPYRGEYRIGVERLELRDPLGLFILRHKIHKLATVNVYPRVAEIEAPELLEALVNNSEVSVLRTEEDYTSISDVRKYTDTDSYKKIHWKLSAKKNELIVKNYQSSTGNKFCLLLDTNPSELYIEDATVELALSFANKLLNENTRVELAYSLAEGALTTLEASDTSGFHAIYSRLAELKFTNGMDTPTALLDYSRGQEDFCTIIVFTQNLDERLCDAIVETQARAYSVMLVFITKARLYSDEARLLEELKAAGVSCMVKEREYTSESI